MVAVPTLLSVNVTKVISITTSSDKSDKNVPFLCLKLLNLMCRTTNKAEQHTIFIHVLFVFYLNFVATSVINHDWYFRRPLYSLCHPTIASPPHHYKCRLRILLISRMEPSSSYDSFKCPQLFYRYSIITFQTIIRWSFPISSYIPERKLLNHAQHEKLPHWKTWYSRRRHFGWEYPDPPHHCHQCDSWGLWKRNRGRSMDYALCTEAFIGMIWFVYQYMCYC